jgi:hypothetical protein
VVAAQDDLRRAAEEDVAHAELVDVEARREHLGRAAADAALGDVTRDPARACGVDDEMNGDEIGGATVVDELRPNRAVSALRVLAHDARRRARRRRALTAGERRRTRARPERLELDGKLARQGNALRAGDPGDRGDQREDQRRSCNGPQRARAATLNRKSVGPSPKKQEKFRSRAITRRASRHEPSMYSGARQPPGSTARMSRTRSSSASKLEANISAVLVPTPSCIFLGPIRSSSYLTHASRDRQIAI